MHALGNARVKRLVLSYDIACQWKLHLRERVFALPVWHASAHEENCRATNSLSYAVGVGRTDGEGIERTWAILNPIGFATKEMGQGNRHDTIEDKVDHLNFEKNAGQEFVEIDSSLNSSVRRDWLRQVKEWVADKSKPNPYLMAKGKDGLSEARVAADLKQAEVKEVQEGRGEFLDVCTTAAAFIKGLLQLEDLKRCIKNEVRGTMTLTANCAGEIDELRASFFKKLKIIQPQQDYFMPGVSSLRLAEEECRDGDRPPPKAEDIKLWLPSDLSDTQRGRSSRGGLVAIEAKLQEAQCSDALSRVRSLLYTKTHLIHHRNANSVGQRASTRSSTLILRVTDQITREATKYRQARTALLRLMGAEYRSDDLKELADADLNVRVEEESDAAARLRLGRVGERRSRNERMATGSGGSFVDLDDAVRVRWAKMMARRDRWIEEVRLLREEMKRVLRSLHAVQGQWERRIECGRQVEPELAEGLRAYAKRQVAVHAWITECFFAEWSKPAKGVVEAVMRKDFDVYRRLLAGEDEDVIMREGSVEERDG
ncbi:hypothetical protein C8F01DRAFT_1081512 [Mycena amicta]|nr:hypothetical protein C8F01DRAFT_1081512 [Mycena amicta]